MAKIIVSEEPGNVSPGRGGVCSSRLPLGSVLTSDRRTGAVGGRGVRKKRQERMKVIQATEPSCGL